MKKFTKVSLIIAAILGGVGILFCGISSLMGGGYGTIRQMARNGKLNYGNWHVKPYGVYYSDWDEAWEDWDESWEDWDESWDDLDEEIDADLEDIDIGDIETGDIDVGDLDTDIWGTHHDSDHQSGYDGTAENTYTFAAAEIENLRLDVNAAVIDFKEGTDDENVVVKLYRIHESYYDNKVENGTLTVEYDTKHHYRTNNHAKIIIEIPAGMQFDIVDLNIGAADAEIGGLSCKELTLYIGAGELTTTGFTVTEKMTVSLGAGALDIGGGTYKDVSLDCGVGELYMAGTVNGNLVADCGIGEVELELLGKNEEDYNYKISCGLGEVEVNGKSYSNLSGSYQATNDGAVGTVDLDCGMGSIDVEIGR